MTAVLDPSKPFSAELHVIRRLNSSLHRGGGGDGLDPGRAGSPRLHPLAGHAMLAPLRDDVPLLDPCCGQLSAGAEVDLGVTGRQKFIDFRHVASALWVPPGFRERPQTVPIHSGIRPDLSKDKAWNSRRIPDAALKAGLNGKTTGDHIYIYITCQLEMESSSDPVKIQLHSLKTSTQAATHDSEPDKHAGPQDTFSSDLRLLTDNSPAALRFRYTSATQRSYEEVSWDAKLPRRLQPPGTTLEKTADPVSERPSSRRYNGRPQLWQSVGADWSRRQLRFRSDAKKPVSFCSGCPRSGQIPSYTGTIGSKNMDDIDNMDEVFHPLTLKRSIIPPYTPTAHRTTIPGYAGKAAYSSSAAAVSVPHVSRPASSSGVKRVHRAIKESRSSAVGHAAPLSRMLTTVKPCNPFLRPELPASRRDVRQSR
ncbi:uncharacterized protein C7orf72 [Stegastes partitus]|uniref:Uncharacterized protein C7orf72 n=1 Tax=Stegastes partitus TaxID=144197 RepID=A0A9Y4JWZ8_9TELE|nr:PREDICTED: uncharacterized protein C7orf72 homolog [Stegastes partitus]